MLKDKTCLLDLAHYPEDFSPCHKRILSARNISPEQLKKTLANLLPTAEFTHADAAAELLYQAIQNHKKIVIVGDYDADGATAMSVMLSVLRYLNANVDSVVPNRVTMGYGLSAAAVDEVLDKQADLVITVDNGINAVEQVHRLNQHHIQTLITDHHLPPEQLPEAAVILNPNCVDSAFPDKALAGVGVAFYLVLALRQVFKAHNDTRLETYPVADLLPLVAVGTVADLVPLSFNNRILVEQGLRRLRHGTGSLGLQALIEVAGLEKKQLNSVDIAFQIAPRLNAAGRIADMQLGVDCLMASSERLAMDYALELDNLNRERKTIENEMKVAAADFLSKHPIAEDKATISLLDAHWNEGLIGILAARIKEKHKKTAFIFTQTEQGLKASARAIAEVNLIDALNQLNRLYPDLMITYGGHAKAAGLTLAVGQFAFFEQQIEAIIQQQLQQKTIDHHIYTDGELLPYELNLDNANFLKTFEPWGMTVPEPVFRNTFYIDSLREVGKNHAQMQLIESRSGQYFKGIAFDKYHEYQQLKQQHCEVAYQLNINRWQGTESLSLTVVHIEESS